MIRRQDSLESWVYVKSMLENDPLGKERVCGLMWDPIRCGMASGLATVEEVIEPECGAARCSGALDRPAHGVVPPVIGVGIGANDHT